MPAKIVELLIPEETTISTALQKMDEVGYKLLILGEKKSRKFYNRFHWYHFKNPV